MMLHGHTPSGSKFPTISARSQNQRDRERERGRDGELLNCGGKNFSNHLVYLDRTSDSSWWKWKGEKDKVDVDVLERSRSCLSRFVPFSIYLSSNNFFIPYKTTTTTTTNINDLLFLYYRNDSWDISLASYFLLFLSSRDNFLIGGYVYS